MEDMKLKLNTVRALQYEERTGKDILVFLEGVAKTNEIKIRDIVDLFMAMGDGYTVEDFDKWDKPYIDKVNAILEAVKEYAQGKK